MLVETTRHLSLPFDTPADRKSFAGAQWVLLVAVFLIGSVAPSQFSILGPLLAVTMIAVIRFPVRTPLALGLALAVVSWVTLSLLWTDLPSVTWPVVQLSWLSFGGYALIVLGVQTRDDLVRVLGALAVSGMLASVIFILFSNPYTIESQWAYLYDPNDGRLTLPWASGNHVAYSIVIGLAAMAAWVRLSGIRLAGRQILALIAAAGVSIYAINLANTRGALISAALVLIFYLAAAHHPVGARRTALALLAGGAFITVTGLLPYVVTRLRIEDAFSRNTDNLSGRYEIWQEALSLVGQRPITGYGVDAYQALLTSGVVAHNVALTVAIGTGVTGLVLYSAWLLACLTRPARQRGAATASLSAVTALLLAASIPIWLSGVWEWALLNWAAMGLCTAANSLTTNTRQQTPTGGPSRPGGPERRRQPKAPRPNPFSSVKPSAGQQS